MRARVIKAWMKINLKTWIIWPVAGKRAIQFCVFKRVFLFTTSSKCVSDILIHKYLEKLDEMRFDHFHLFTFLTTLVPQPNKFFNEARWTAFLHSMLRFVSDSNVHNKTAMQRFHYVCTNSEADVANFY